MPYVDISSRDSIKDQLDKGILCPNNAGELNYVISMLCDQYLQVFGKKYSTLNEIIGVLECAKQEFYRRIVSPYEDKKMLVNGDVYASSED